LLLAQRHHKLVVRILLLDSDDFFYLFVRVNTRCFGGIFLIKLEPHPLVYHVLLSFGQKVLGYGVISCLLLRALPVPSKC